MIAFQCKLEEKTFSKFINFKMMMVVLTMAMLRGDTDGDDETIC